MSERQRSRRQPALRMFALEYYEASLVEQGSGQYDPSFVITKLGARVNRMCVAGLLERMERRESESGTMYHGSLRDPTGLHMFSVGSFQPELHADMEELLSRHEENEPLLLLAVVASLALGARDVSLAQVWAALVDPVAGDNDHLVVRDLRVPRTLVGLVGGAALGVAGALMQGVTRNPIADPGLLGINSGASLAVLGAISLLGVTSVSGYLWFAFAGAALAAVVVYGGMTSTTGTVILNYYAIANYPFAAVNAIMLMLAMMIGVTMILRLVNIRKEL